MCPGKYDRMLKRVRGNRDLGVDLDAARTCGATAVVTLVVRDELKLLRTRNFFKMCSEGPNCDSLFPSGPLGGGRTKRRNGAGGITLAQPEGRHFLLPLVVAAGDVPFQQYDRFGNIWAFALSQFAGRSPTEA